MGETLWYDVSSVAGVIGSDLALQVVGGHVKEANLIPKTVGSCCSALIRVDLHLKMYIWV